MNLNKIQVIGRITKQPELKSLPSGSQVVSFGVATNHIYNDKEGKRQEKTTFHNVVAFGKTAETIAKWFIKGQEIYVEGRQEHRSYDKPDGSKGYASEIILDRFDFGQKPKGGSGDGVDHAPEDSGSQDDGGEIDPDSIPF